MLPDRVSNPGPLTYESSALPTVLRGKNETGSDASIPYHQTLDNVIAVGFFYKTLRNLIQRLGASVHYDNNKTFVTVEIYTFLEFF